jgi:hypothetical protein
LMWTASKMWWCCSACYARRRWPSAVSGPDVPGLPSHDCSSQCSTLCIAFSTVISQQTSGCLYPPAPVTVRPEAAQAQVCREQLELQLAGAQRTPPSRSGFYSGLICSPHHTLWPACNIEIWKLKVFVVGKGSAGTSRGKVTRYGYSQTVQFSYKRKSAATARQQWPPAAAATSPPGRVSKAGLHGAGWVGRIQAHMLTTPREQLPQCGLHALRRRGTCGGCSAHLPGVESKGTHVQESCR